jgi:citrate synthase
MSFETSVGTSDADSITVMGRDLSRDLMGRVSLTELAFLMVQRRLPSAEETRLFDAVLVSLADHGLTPTVLAARLTHTGAPEALQGAVAAGLLGAGSVFLGVVEDTVLFLDEIGDDVEGGVARAIDAGRRIPGLGHPVHKVEDPRTPRIYEIADETGLTGTYLARLREVSAAYAKRTGGKLPINGAGVAGAALADLGFPGPLLRGFALLARTAGLLGHLAEELQSPIGMRLYREVDERAIYSHPTLRE